MGSITERLAALMTEKGLKAIDLAEATSVNASSISRILKGTQVPSSDTLYKLACFFDVSMEYLLTGNNENTDLSRRQPGMYIGDVKITGLDRLMNCFYEMDEDDRYEMIQLAEIKAQKAKRKKDIIFIKNPHNK